MKVLIFLLSINCAFGARTTTPFIMTTKALIKDSFNCTHQLGSVKPHPSTCCDYPISTISNPSIKTCYKECPILKAEKSYKNNDEWIKDKCCLLNCLYRVENILTDSGTDFKINVTNLKTSFKMRAMPILTDEWNEIIANAVDACIPLFEPDRIIMEGECLPEFFLNIVTCIYNEMFLNCAGFQRRRQECKNLITIVNKCKSYGTLSIKDWDYFYF